ncbi:ABC transporter permease [Paenibacillus sp. 1001270B_150601_E10]|uniref:ABC transporter permease n=1 Tax=Paenibacillus sp. 1001270B_150601_E10 TaxID=2787079 RepID=UPI0018A0F2DC|nr:ABC transporter permease [Paenibacillus sp. 1001270B_150601_E10]
MLKLIKLEMQKFKAGWFIRGALIATLLILGLITSMGYIAAFENEIFTEDMVLLFTDTMVRATFIVFASVLISKFVIEEFRSKTITLMFTYPVNRKKLMIAKLIIIVLFAFCSIIASQLIVLTLYSLISSFITTFSVNVTAEMILNQLPSIFMNALSASLMSLIPLYFGMKKYSTTTTISSSLLIVLLVCQNFGDFSLNTIIFIPITLAVIGASIAYLSVKNIEERDVL